MEEIKRLLEIVFDKVTIENDSSIDVRIIVEQNEQRILRTFNKTVYDFNKIDIEHFCKGFAMEIMNEFIDKGMK